MLIATISVSMVAVSSVVMPYLKIKSLMIKLSVKFVHNPFYFCNGMAGVDLNHQEFIEFKKSNHYTSLSLYGWEGIEI